MREREREREGKEEEEEEEEVVEEVEDIFRAAPNQLLRQFVSVGANGRARERESHASSTLKINMQPTRSLRGRGEERVEGRAGKRRDEAETDERRKSVSVSVAASVM